MQISFIFLYLSAYIYFVNSGCQVYGYNYGSQWFGSGSLAELALALSEGMDMSYVVVAKLLSSNYQFKFDKKLKLRCLVFSFSGRMGRVDCRGEATQSVLVGDRTSNDFSHVPISILSQIEATVAIWIAIISWSGLLKSLKLYGFLHLQPDIILILSWFILQVLKMVIWGWNFQWRGFVGVSEIKAFSFRVYLLGCNQG